MITAQTDLSEEIESLFTEKLNKKINRDGRFTKYSPIYSFATEKISGYYPQLSFEGKKVLTVCGSGDHIINAYLLGAEDVVAFDSNVLAGLYTELKTVAMKNLPRREFKKFLMRSKKALDFGVYRSVRDELSDLCRMFFDKAYEYFGCDGFRLRESCIFNTAHDNNKEKIKNNLYLSSRRSYSHAQGNLKRTPVIESDVRDLSDKLNGDVFDIILLSNIADYAKYMYPDDTEYLRTFCQEAIAPLMQHLARDGVICAAYVYEDYNTCPNTVRESVLFGCLFRSQVDSPKKRKEVFQEFGDYKELVFPSTISDQNDAVIILQNNGGE